MNITFLFWLIVKDIVILSIILFFDSYLICALKNLWYENSNKREDDD